MSWEIEPEIRLRVFPDYPGSWAIGIYGKTPEGQEQGLMVEIPNKAAFNTLIARLQDYRDSKCPSS